jgi:hypothetical protein
MLTLDEAIEVLSTEPINQAIAEIRIAAAAAEVVIVKILDAEASGAIDADDANEQIQNVLALEVQAKCEALEAEADVSLDLGDVADELDAIELTGSPIQTFGEGVCNLILEQCDSIEEGMMAISQETGIDLDRLDDIAADEAMPSPEEAMAILSQFHGLDENDIDHAMSLVAGGMGNYSNDNAQLARFSHIQSQLDEQRQAIAAQYEVDNLCARFRYLSDRADRAADNKQLTPAERRELIPQVDADRLRETIVYFARDTDVEANLDKIESQLEFIEKSEPKNYPIMANFSQNIVPKSGNDFLESYRAANGY